MWLVLEIGDNWASLSAALSPEERTRHEEGRTRQDEVTRQEENFLFIMNPD